jgi:predicted dehydrogenase
MDLALSHEDEAFRDEVRRFLDDNLSEDLREAGRKTGGVFADIAAGVRWHKMLAQRGWSAPNWPTEYGGTGWSATQRYIFSRECTAADAPRIFAMGIRMVGPVRRVHAQVLSHKGPPDPHDSLSALLEFECGISGTLAAVRSTPMFWRVHVFGREGSAEALGRSDLVIRKTGAETEHLTFPAVDSVRANLEAFADAVAGVAPYPITPREMVDVVAAFEAIAKAAASGRAQDL